MRSRNVVLVLTAVLIAGFLRTALAADEAAPPPPAEAKMPLMPAPCIVPTTRILHPRMADVLAARLSLTDDQKTRVADLLKSADEKLAPQIEAQQKAARDFASALSKADAKEADLIAAAENAMKAETVIITERIKTLSALRALLTAEQNRTLSELLEQYTSPWRVQGSMPRTAPPRGTPPAADDGGEDRR